MPNYRVSFIESKSGSVLFEADDLESAKQLLRQVNDGEIYLEDLPNMYKRIASANYLYDRLELLP